MRPLIDYPIAAVQLYKHIHKTTLNGYIKLYLIICININIYLSSIYLSTNMCDKFEKQWVRETINIGRRGRDNMIIL